MCSCETNLSSVSIKRCWICVLQAQSASNLSSSPPSVIILTPGNLQRVRLFIASSYASFCSFIEMHGARDTGTRKSGGRFGGWAAPGDENSPVFCWCSSMSSASFRAAHLFGIQATKSVHPEISRPCHCFPFDICRPFHCFCFLDEFRGRVLTFHPVFLNI